MTHSLVRLLTASIVAALLLFAAPGHAEAVETAAPTVAAQAPTARTAQDDTTTTAPAQDEDTGENPASIVANGLLLVLGAAGAFFAIRWWRKRRGSPTY